jgi:hypothetical protein|tara:strand:- start:940 stop:1143 length:204 start_codon:yes stop_codon:yes gene_type:complete
MNKYNFTVNKLVTSFSKVNIEANSIEEASEIARLQAEEEMKSYIKDTKPETYEYSATPYFNKTISDS